MTKNQILTILFAIIIIPLVLAFNGCTANKPERDLLIFPTTTTTTTAPAVTTTTGVGTTTTTTATSTTLTTTTNTTTTTSITTTTTTTTTTTLPRLENPVLPDSGIFEGGFGISIINPNLAGDIYYTIDGTTPNQSSLRYTVPFIITDTTTVSAIVIADGYENSNVVGGSYFIRGWKEVGGGISLGLIYTMVVDDFGNLYVGGNFSSAGDVVGLNSVAVWDGENWHPLGEGFRNIGFSANVFSLAIGSDGYLYAGGMFTHSGATVVNNIARWDISSGWDTGSEWEPVGNGFNHTVFAVLPIDHMGSFRVVAGGSFTRDGDDSIDLHRIAMWDGSAWSEVLEGTNNSVLALAYDGSQVYVGGEFDRVGASPVTRANYIASFIPDTSWSTLGLSGSGTDDIVRALSFRSDGNLIVGGDFTQVIVLPPGGRIDANHVAAWDTSTSSWLTMEGFNQLVRALANDGTTIYAGGDFDALIGGDPMNHIARWNDTAEVWQSLGSGINGRVDAIVISGDGRIYVGGSFDRAGGELARNIAVWGIK